MHLRMNTEFCPVLPVLILLAIISKIKFLIPYVDFLPFWSSPEVKTIRAIISGQHIYIVKMTSFECHAKP